MGRRRRRRGRPLSRRPRRPRGRSPPSRRRRIPAALAGDPAGYPAGATCGDFSAARTQVYAISRRVTRITGERIAWRTTRTICDTSTVPGSRECLARPGCPHYLANQFEFEGQYLTVVEETCAADTYIASWSLDMDLGTGNLRGMPGISVLKFAGGWGRGWGRGRGRRRKRGALPRDFTFRTGRSGRTPPIVGPLVKFQRETYVGCMLSPGGCADLLMAPKWCRIRQTLKGIC